MGENCLIIEDLTIEIGTRQGRIRPVNNLSLTVPTGNILGIVGESGSGKSLLAKSIVRLNSLQVKNIITKGNIWFKGQNLLTLPDPQMRQIRGRSISMVFQDPLAALNPVLPVGWQLKELFVKHLQLPGDIAYSKSIELLEKVGLANAAKVYRQFSYQLSGGMRQRVMIAMALALQPELIIADEPTTALDVTIQAQILLELKRMQRELGTTIIIISHDMGVIAEIADQVAVMHQGEIVELADCYSIFDNPRQEYTKNLIAASRMELKISPEWSKNCGVVTA